MEAPDSKEDTCAQLSWSCPVPSEVWSRELAASPKSGSTLTSPPWRHGSGRRKLRDTQEARGGEGGARTGQAHGTTAHPASGPQLQVALQQVSHMYANSTSGEQSAF